MPRHYTPKFRGKQGRVNVSTPDMSGRSIPNEPGIADGGRSSRLAGDARNFGTPGTIEKPYVFRGRTTPTHTETAPVVSKHGGKPRVFEG